MKLSFILLGLAVGLGACSSKDQPDPYATVAEFCTEWGKAACTNEAVQRCNGVDASTETLTNACVASQEAFCQGLLPATGYSSKNAGQCLSAVQAAYSDGKLTALEIATVRHRGAPCNQLIKGAQSEGETCTVDDDCDTLGGYLCLSKAGAGTCQIPTIADNGTSCEAADKTCNPGFYCDSNCIESKAVGGKCAEDFECATGLVCNPDTLKCAAKVSATACRADSECTTNVCDIPMGAETGRCVSTITLSSSTGICADLL